MGKRWDVFISHASEDKETIVKALAGELSAWGVRVWYDEFELKLGDSLSKKIDEGLAQSSFGLVILSKSFFAKQWTEYEFRSLLSRNTSGERVILPIWHGIGKEDVREYSLYLSDIMALSTEMGTEKLAVEIVRRVCPDILDSHARFHMAKKMEREPGCLLEVPRERLRDSEVRHQRLPHYLVISCRLIEEVFHDILNTSYVEIVNNFAKDWDYDREFIVWSCMANAYIQFIRETHCDYQNIPKKKEAFCLLLGYSMTGEFAVDLERYKLLDEREQVYLVHTYLENRKHIGDMIGKMSGPEE